MKLSALAAIVKESGHCYRVTAANGRQFISTGYGVYNMDGYPKSQNKEELAAMLGISSKKMESIFFDEKTAENNIIYGVSLADDPDNEEPTEKLSTSIVVSGEEHIALRHPDGSVGFIRASQLKPVESELSKEYAAICVRWGSWRDEKPFYAIKDGMYLRAIILPATLGESTAEDLNEILASMLAGQKKTEDKE